jgi:hypothetical protein
VRSKILQHLFLNKQPRIFASQTRDITELLIINYPKEQILGGTNLCSWLIDWLIVCCLKENETNWWFGVLQNLELIRKWKYYFF